MRVVIGFFIFGRGTISKDYALLSKGAIRMTDKDRQERANLSSTKISPNLNAWVREKSAPLRRTVVIQFLMTKDPKEAVAELQAAGLEIQSSGRGTLIAITEAETLRQIENLSWIQSISEPRKLDMKFPPDLK